MEKTMENLMEEEEYLELAEEDTEIVTTKETMEEEETIEVKK